MSKSWLLLIVLEGREEKILLVGSPSTPAMAFGCCVLVSFFFFGIPSQKSVGILRAHFLPDFEGKKLEQIFNH